MEFNFGLFSLHLPPLHITLILIAIIFLFIRWSKHLQSERYKVFLYFLISIVIAPIYAHNTRDGVFELWVPLGFIFVILYLLLITEKYHPVKLKASLLGLCFALYQLIVHYAGSFSS